MQQDNAWRDFFAYHAESYEENCFTKNTLNEIEFLLDELKIQPGASILDVGCGTGRHSVQLAKRGYKVTGLDLSPDMLRKAKEAAQRECVSIEFVNADAKHFSFAKKFDAAICLCEGAFGLLSQTDDPIEQPFAILKNISNSLKPSAKALLTVLNAHSMIRRYSNDDVSAGRFDPITCVETTSAAPMEGKPAFIMRERAFVPNELMLLCRLAGLKPLHFWGGTAGNWGRRAIDLDEIEIMFVAQKPA